MFIYSCCKNLLLTEVLATNIWCFPQWEWGAVIWVAWFYVQNCLSMGLVGAHSWGVRWKKTWCLRTRRNPGKAVKKTEEVWKTHRVETGNADGEARSRVASCVIVVQPLSHGQLFVTPWSATLQASLSFTISWSLLKLMSIKLVMPPAISSSAVPFFSCPQSFLASGSFPMSQFFASGGQSIRASASASVLPMNIKDWFPLELTGWISLQSKGLSRVFSKTTVQKHQFFSTQPSLWSNTHIHAWLLEKP